MKDELRKLVKAVAFKEFNVRITPEIDYPDPKFGDLSTNVAFKIAKDLNQNPLKIAQQLKLKLSHKYLEGSTVEGQGFINFFLNWNWIYSISDEINRAGSEYGRPNDLKDKTVVVGFTDPNPFKEFHIGHLYSNVIGESISRLYESRGARVHRVTYQGDVGMHVAKSIWGILKALKKEKKNLHEIKGDNRIEFLAKAYAAGALAYEKDKSVKEEIVSLNKKIYELSDAKIGQVYKTGRKWSLEYFETIYERLGTKFERNYWERDIAQAGSKLVRDYIKSGVFEKSRGAIVFKGENSGLHTRVFINSEGLPTYEAKDFGLAMAKQDDYDPDLSIVITGNEQAEYFKVVLAALTQINPRLVGVTKHMPHGMVRLQDGKMSSRTGRIITATWLIDRVKELLSEFTSDSEVLEVMGLSAIKYGFLKNAIGQNIQFKTDELISLNGNSGPYLQYTYARANSIIDKSRYSTSTKLVKTRPGLEAEEEALLKLLARYPEIVKNACEQFSPHILTHYVFNIAQQFNGSYEKYKIIGSSDEESKVAVVHAVHTVMENCFNLLGIVPIRQI